jgi:hypothetical protein
MSIGRLAISGILAGALSLLAVGAEAQTAAQTTRLAQAAPAAADRVAQQRPPRRIHIYPRYEAGPDVYPRYNPGPNAVRVCSASYVQEFRPSGTVIVPHTTCVWRQG